MIHLTIILNDREGHPNCSKMLKCWYFNRNKIYDHAKLGTCIDPFAVRPVDKHRIIISLS